MFDGSYGGNRGCDPARSYSNIDEIIRNLEDDPTLYQDMKTYWASNKGDDNWFWSHEWIKHGTCVTTLEPHCYAEGNYTKHKEVGEYFRTALNLRSKYDIYAAFKDNDIVPNAKKTYPVQKMKQAILDKYGLEATFSCRGSRLQEITLWFRVRGRDRYVPTQPLRKDTCRNVRFLPKA
ncbi:hypothetical protein H4219_005940 [Mycoemilia scoparia]|uniref:ribonuclease T2 n=1 Tax=Mycoemilia scoparia TaxID=417184 RepID=A0A9W7ZRF4_9FUNG|nr:hypothetical protein H4219_005940 [Mycoemilia scoparia]